MTSPDPSTLQFDERGLIVAVAQDAATGTVLMVAYMDREALSRTAETGEAHFWSRRRQRLDQLDRPIAGIDINARVAVGRHLGTGSSASLSISSWTGTGTG